MLLARDCFVHVFVGLEIDQAFEMILLREARNETFLMLSDPPDQIVGEPDIQNMCTIRHYIYNRAWGSAARRSFDTARAAHRLRMTK